jgi:hypothetical protein
MPPQTKVAMLRKNTTAITRPAPFPFGKGGGIGHILISFPFSFPNHLTEHISIPRVIVPASEFVIDLICNAVMLAAFADSFILNASIFEKPVYYIMN